MKSAIVLLALAVTVEAVNILTYWPDLDLSANCRLARYAEANNGDPTTRFYHDGRAKDCAQYMKFFIKACACLPLITMPVRPNCDTGIYKVIGTEDLQAYINSKHIHYVGTNDFIKKRLTGICYAKGAYAQLDWTQSNDFGTRMRLDFDVTISAGGAQTTSGEDVVIFTNRCGTIQPTFEMTYSPTNGLYTVIHNSDRSSCTPIPNINDGNLAFSRTVDVTMWYDNGRLTFTPRVNAAQTCDGIAGGNIFAFRRRTLAGNACPLRFGSMGQRNAEVCFKRLIMTRDCARDTGVRPTG